MEENKKLRNDLKKENKKKFELIDLVKSYKKFYRDNLKKKHIIIFAIMFVIFFVMLSYFLINLANENQIIVSEIANENITNTTFFNKVVKEKIPLLAVIIFAGITPFAFLPVLGIMGSYNLAFEVCLAYATNSSKVGIVLGSIGSIIQIIAISLSVAAGIYYCLQSSKKFTYNQYMTFGLKDLKEGIYKIRKDEKKLEKLYEKERVKKEKKEKLNVKIPYINLLISFLLSVIISFFGAVIQNII